MIPHGLVAGNDYMIHWLGCDARTPSWRGFIAEIVNNSGFDEALSTLVLEHLQTLIRVLISCLATLSTLRTLDIPRL